MRRAEKPCSSLSISKRSLLLETKAISMPEKKPESMRMAMVASISSEFMVDFDVLSVRCCLLPLLAEVSRVRL